MQKYYFVLLKLFFFHLLFDLSVGKIKYSFNADDPIMKIGIMFGFLSKGTNGLQIHNKIFEIRITNYFITKNNRKWRENNIVQTCQLFNIQKYGQRLSTYI